MITANQYIQDTSTATHLISGSFHIYKGIRGIFNTVFTMLIILIAIPFIWVALRYLRIKIKNSGKFDSLNLTADRYKNFRLNYDALSDLVNKLKEIPDFKMESIPFILRGIVKEILLIKSEVISNHQNMRQKLDGFNSRETKIRGQLFKKVSEDALWKKRTTTYDYLV